MHIKKSTETLDGIVAPSAYYPGSLAEVRAGPALEEVIPASRSAQRNNYAADHFKLDNSYSTISIVSTSPHQDYIECPAPPSSLS